MRVQWLQCDQIWRNFNILQYFEGLFGIWNNFEPTLVIIYVNGQMAK